MTIPPSQEGLRSAIGKAQTYAGVATARKEPAACVATDQSIGLGAGILGSRLFARRVQGVSVGASFVLAFFSVTASTVAASFVGSWLSGDGVDASAAAHAPNQGG